MATIAGIHVNISYLTSVLKKCLPCFSEPYILGGQPTDDRIYVESRIERAPDYTEDRIEEWRVSEIIISNVKRQDDGLYECKAQNEGGEFFKSGHIQVRQSNLPVNLLGAAGTTVQIRDCENWIPIR